MVDLAELIEALKAEVSPPGTDLYPGAANDDDAWLLRLQNAFWECVLYGVIEGFVEDAASRGGETEWSAGIVTPSDAEADYDVDGYVDGTDLSRELQQLIVLWAGWKTVLAQMQNVKTRLRTKAGPVEYEKDQSASVLKAVLDALKEKLDFIIDRLSALSGGSATVFDGVIERDCSICSDGQWWVR